MRSEDVILIHHKLDTIMKLLVGLQPGPVPKPIPGCGGVTNSYCPFCNQSINIDVDPVKGEITRRCGCDLGVIATGPAPILGASGNNSYAFGKDKDE